MFIKIVYPKKEIMIECDQYETRKGENNDSFFITIRKLLCGHEPTYQINKNEKCAVYLMDNRGTTIDKIFTNL